MLAPVLPFGSMFPSSIAKLPFAATKTIIKAIIRFNSGLNFKAITSAAAPPPNTQFVVQKSMPMNYAFSQGRFMWVYGMLHTGSMPPAYWKYAPRGADQGFARWQLVRGPVQGWGG